MDEALRKLEKPKPMDGPKKVDIGLKKVDGPAKVEGPKKVDGPKKSDWGIVRPIRMEDWVEAHKKRANKKEE